MKGWSNCINCSKNSTVFSYTVLLTGCSNPGEKEELIDALQQMITQKFPGMNFVFAENEINSDGIMDTWTIGYRFIIHLGFRF